MDQDKLIGATEHVITEREVNAWLRGQQDAANNKLLKIQSRLNLKQAVSFLSWYATSGDVHGASMRHDISTQEGNRLLDIFGIRSIEDAKSLLESGSIGELNQANQEKVERDEAQRRQDQELAQEKFAQSQTTPSKPTRSFGDRQREAELKNKQDALRALIANGVDPKTGKSGMKIPVTQIAEFKAMIPHGVTQLKNKFGGTRNDIISEIRRLSPDTHIDMLRP